MVDPESWIKRADEVIDRTKGWNNSEALQFATSMIAAFYGPNSPQMQTFRETTDGIQKSKAGSSVPYMLSEHGKATIQNIKGEISAGLISSVRALLTGEIIADLLATAKDILSDNSEGSKNVGAVLVAAGYEDILRRMGLELAGLTSRPKLEEVISALKQKDVLKGGEPATALGYLKFRNDSLHADWAKVQRSQVNSCLAFAEALVTKHFSG